MRLLLLSLGPYLFWVVLSVMIWLYRYQLIQLIGLIKNRRAHFRYLKYLTINQHDAKVRLELGEKELRWGNYRPALKLFQEALRIDSQNCDAHYFLGLTYMKLKDYPQALRQFDHCRRLKPDYRYGEALVRSGDAQLLLKDYPAALKSYQKQLAAYPYHAEALYKSGLAHYRLKEVTAARELFDRTIAEVKALPQFRYRQDRIWLYKACWLRLITKLF